MVKQLKIGVIGGGIGGSALAASLLQQGFDVEVFEKAAAFGEVGAGVQMTPNAVKVIKALGLFEKMMKVGFLPEAVVGRNWRSSRENFRIPLKGEFQRFYDAPYVQIHRADLLELFTSTLPVEKTHFSKICKSVKSTSNGAIAEFEDGTHFEADLIVGADGVRSAVRSSLFGEEDPKYTGHMCYRATVPVDGIVDYVKPESTFWLGPNSHIVTYYIKGGKAVNIVAVCESKSWIEESWNAKSSRADLLADFTGWHDNIQTLFSKVEEVFRWGLFDRDPMARWSKGNITLLGDAAHPMLPFLSQGAAMAIEDGFVLAAALSQNIGNMDAALMAYEKERKERTSRVQLEARERGRTYHLPSRLAQARRDLDYRLRSIFNPKTTGIKTDWVYEYDARKFANKN